jgi:hypothetical protein
MILHSFSSEQIVNLSISYQELDSNLLLGVEL